MNIVVNGLPYFSKKLVDDLQAFAPQHRFRFYDTYNSKFEQLKFGLALRKADLVIPMNGVSDPSGSMDLAVKMKKKIYSLGIITLLATITISASANTYYLSSKGNDSNTGKSINRISLVFRY